MTYTIVKNEINSNKIKYQFKKQDESKLTYAEFLRLIKEKNKEFLKTFRKELERIPLDLGQNDERKFYVWKCVPVSKKTLNKEFEFIVLREDAFENIRHDYSPFQEHFKGGSEVVSFPSLSGTTLIVPTPKKESDFPCPYPGDATVDYKNLDKFCSLCPLKQWDELWQKVGEKMEEELNSGDTTRWLNTHGLDVHHLHVRLDKDPKYYQGVEEYQVETKTPLNNNDNHQIIAQLKTNAKQTIAKLLKESSLKTSDLDSKFANWETDLDKLDTKTKIQEFQQQLEQAIKDKQQNSESNKNNGLSLPIKILIGGGVLIVILGLAGVIWFKAKKKKKKKIVSMHVKCLKFII